jgi:hypothetical protein
MRKTKPIFMVVVVNGEEKHTDFTWEKGDLEEKQTEK